MVGAGFPGSVAPLGTALTENQLALLWKMADEPILCFDGDKAGQKAAWRAADLALPHLKPGKSLRFALLPEGQDPDDLARSGGRGAIEEVIGGGARARRCDLVARDRRRQLRHAGAARGAGSADQRTHQRHPRRGGAALLSPGSGRAAAARPLRRKAAAAAMARGNYRSGGGNFGGESGRRFAPPRLVHPGRGGPIRTPRRARAGLGRQPDHQPPALPGGQPAARPEPDHARPAQRDFPPRGADSAIPDQSSLAAARPSGRGGGAGIGASGSAQTARRHHRRLRHDHHHTGALRHSAKMRADLSKAGFSASSSKG